MSPAWTRIRKHESDKSAPQVAEPRKEAAPTPEAIEFSAMRLNAGDPLQMQPVADDHVRHYVTLIGWVEKRSVLVTAPVHEGHVQLVREGQPFVLRVFSGRNAYAFDASVLKSCGAPFPYLHLSYPKTVQALPVRSEERVRVNLIGAVSGVPGATESDPLACLVVDLSLSGAMVTAARKLAPAGSEFRLSLRVTVNQTPVYIKLPCIVRNLRDVPANDGGATVYQHGVQFHDVDEKDELLLENVIFRAMLAKM